LCAKEREFEAFLDLLIKVDLRVILLPRQQREDKRIILADTRTGNLLRTSGDSSDGESHGDDDNDGDDCDNDNGRDAGRVSVEVARVPALVSATDWSTNKARKANEMLCLLAHVIRGCFALSKRGTSRLCLSSLVCHPK
jgi:hypothetical protein